MRLKKSFCDSWVLKRVKASFKEAFINVEKEKLLCFSYVLASSFSYSNR